MLCLLVLPKIVSVSTTAMLQIQVVQDCKIGSSLNSQQSKTELFKVTVNMIFELLNTFRTVHSNNHVLCFVPYTNAVSQMRVPMKRQ